MKKIRIIQAALAFVVVLVIGLLSADDNVSDSVIENQRAALAAASVEAGFGPQSPRDLSDAAGSNPNRFGLAPAYSEMHLCNIHFHEHAEHRGGNFTTYAGNGNGEGFGTGYRYDGELTDAELAPVDYEVGKPKHGALEPGDTIEVHYVFSSADVVPGPTLAACLSESIANPQLRVEAQVFVLVNDDSALDFGELAKLGEVNGYQQAVNIPNDTGTPIQYEGSTTGPGYNEVASPLQVSWSVRPEVAKLSIKSLAEWLKDNPFDEDHAHGVRNLVKNPALLSEIDG